MTDRVSPKRIEQIVGVQRHQTKHYGRAVSAEQTVYILHSRACRAWNPDLRECPFSLALDRGIDLDRWVEDVPVELAIDGGRLVPDTEEPTA